MDRMTLDADWQKARLAEQRGDLRAAIEHYRILARRFPSDPELLFALARAAVRLGDHVTAENALAGAIRLDPESAPLRINYAFVQKQLGKTDAARRELEAALRLAPGNVLALYNLGNLWRDSGALDRAEACYRQALSSDARHVDSLYNLSCLLRDRDEIAEAKSMFETAVHLNPKRFDAWHNLANVRRAEGDIKGARQAYEAALSGGEWALPRYALGTLDLLEGNWTLGWAGYESRWEANGIPKPGSRLPLWQGEDTGPDSALLIHSEQGYGDFIQFARFLPLLARRFVRVGVHCSAPLIRLLRHNFGDAVAVFETLPEEQAASYTHQVPIMSLGKALQVGEAMLKTIAVPYLQADAPHRFDEEDAPFRIGFTWTGNPAHAENARRSIPLDMLASLFSTEGTRWYSLQKGMGDALVPWRQTVRDESNQWQDFADAANFIDSLDLVITVCTAQAHLAGALGKPVWLMSRFDADWRWLLERTDSPWYRTMRIFRQPSRGDWKSVIENIRAMLPASEHR